MPHFAAALWGTEYRMKSYYATLAAWPYLTLSWLRLQKASSAARVWNRIILWVVMPAPICWASPTSLRVSKWRRKSEPCCWMYAIVNLLFHPIRMASSGSRSSCGRLMLWTRRVKSPQEFSSREYVRSTPLSWRYCPMFGAGAKRTCPWWWNWCTVCSCRA